MDISTVVLFSIILIGFVYFVTKDPFDWWHHEHCWSFWSSVYRMAPCRVWTNPLLDWTRRYPCFRLDSGHWRLWRHTKPVKDGGGMNGMSGNNTVSVTRSGIVLDAGWGRLGVRGGNMKHKYSDNCTCFDCTEKWKKVLLGLLDYKPKKRSKKKVKK